MAFFTQTDHTPALYLADITGDTAGALAFVTGQNQQNGPPNLSLDQALTDTSLHGTFIFSNQKLDFDDDPTRQANFVTAVQNQVSRKPTSRGVMWTGDPDNLATATIVPFFGLAGNGSELTSGLSDGFVLPSMTINMQNGMSVVLNDTTMTIGSGTVAFAGGLAPQMTPANMATLEFDGPYRGCLTFAPYIQRYSLDDVWNWGFHFTIPEADATQGEVSEWLPLASANDGPTDMLGFLASFDLANPMNTMTTCGQSPDYRSILFFTGQNQDQTPTTLASNYRTVSGDPITLLPIGKTVTNNGQITAGLVFTEGQRISDTASGYYAGPVGDFVLDAEPGPTGKTAELLCGLSGSEFISFLPGTDASSASVMRFQSGMAAYSDKFPPPVASPTAPPQKTVALLSTKYATSWVSFIAPEGEKNTYAAQPDGAALFGYDPYIHPGSPILLGHMDPGCPLPSDGQSFFPLVPYAGFGPEDGVPGFTQDQARKFETLIIGPTRRSIIGTPAEKRVISAKGTAANLLFEQSVCVAGGQNALTNLTTPSGILARIDASAPGAPWEQILLGQLGNQEFAFNKPSDDLIQAFQTNQLFLMVANPDGLSASGGNFANQLDIGGWKLEADVGASPQYGDYANVMIVKGIEGPLFDPDGDPTKNLVASPDKWTQAKEFASPTTADNSTPDEQQMLILSSWLQEYFKASLSEDEGKYFAHFNQIAKDPNWTGILVLRAKIADTPDDLVGIKAGIRNPDRFYAHHFGVEISQIKNDPSGNGIEIDKDSSVFGLIYYEDAAYNPVEPKTPVAPQYGVSYDFITLTLKVLFENSAVKDFASYTQLALNSLFSSPVTGMSEGGNTYKSLLMEGTFQNNDGHPTYGMKSIQDYGFLFSNNVLAGVDIVSAEMITIKADSDPALVRFAFAGSMDFHILKGNDGQDIDLFSFGKTADGSGAGLDYNGLGLMMSFNDSDPVGSRLIRFDSSEIAFNVKAENARPGSLFHSISMELEGLVTPDNDEATPQTLGYLPVVTNVRMNNVAASWNGLKYKVNLGTAGELASKLGLNAYLLLAWEADSLGDNYRAQAALKMPGTSNGAPLISLQNVLAMSYGTIQLLYTDTPGEILHPTTLKPITYRPGQDDFIPLPGPGNGSKQYMFVLNEIAIKFLGLLKIPPNGSTAFYLFGDADPQAQSPDKTGLAWYGVYNNEPKSKSSAPLIEEGDRHE